MARACEAHKTLSCVWNKQAMTCALMSVCTQKALDLAHKHESPMNMYMQNLLTYLYLSSPTAALSDVKVCISAAMTSRAVT